MKSIKKEFVKYYKYSILIGYYFKRLSFSKLVEKPRIIICFDGNISHGGLVDRMKGIVSFYEISKILDFDFKIVFNNPFELTDFVKPNSVNWLINNKDVKYTLFLSKILYLNNDFKSNPLELIKQSKVKTFFVYSNVDYLPIVYPNKTNEMLREIWRENYLALFEKSDYLNEKLTLLPQESGIVFHTRFTSLLGDFIDSTQLVLDEKDKQVLIRRVVKSITDTALLCPNKTIYVLSDSELFLNYIKNNTFYNTLEGTPRHLEFNNNNDSSFHAKTFLDFYFIARSESIFLVKIDKMYNSSFSKYASIIGDKNFKIITA